MPCLRPLVVALFAGAALVWTLPAFAVYPGSCTNGRAVYIKTSPSTTPFSCSHSTCHTNNPANNVKHIQNGAANPAAINFALDGTGANAEMVALDLRNNLPLSAQDIDDLATYIFYGTCPAASPVLQAAPSPVAFGSTTVGSTSAPIAVTVTNVGTANATGVSLTNTNATEFIVSGSTCTGTITANGGTCGFSVAFKPSASGSRSGNVVVNRSGGPGVTVGVSGTGTSGATPGQLSMPASISFGSHNVGSTSSASSITVSNTGGAAVTVSSVASSNTAEFSIVSNSCTTVNAGANCNISVTFKPTSTGARSATITVTSNGTGSPQNIGASGTGTSAAPQPGQLSMTTATSFASQTVGTTSAAKAVSVTNIGGQPVVVTSVSSSNPSEFAVTNSTCATVNAGAGCTISLTFTPGTTGTRSATITVVSNGTGSPQTISASGTGAAATSAATVTVVEYHHASFDHYFITPVAAEIALLDAHAPPFQDWSRTGFSFTAYVNATAPVSSAAICRFFNSTFAPKSSHFYAAHGLGCEATLAGFPDWGLEDDKLFNTMLPDASGNCPSGTIPVYRLYNQGMGSAPNHRFVTSLAERQNTINKGFVAEGVGMCVPP